MLGRGGSKMSAVELNIKVCDFCPVASRWGNHEYAPTCGEEPHDFSAASMYLFFLGQLCSFV